MASTAELAQLIQRLENVAVKLETSLGAAGTPPMEGTIVFSLTTPLVVSVWCWNKVGLVLSRFHGIAEVSLNIWLENVAT